MCEWNDGGMRCLLPDRICSWKQNRTVCIDECIIEQIKALWAEGFETLGCCCGHGREYSSVIVGDGYKDEDISKITEILQKYDGRSWLVLQWRLQTVAST